MSLQVNDLRLDAQFRELPDLEVDFQEISSVADQTMFGAMSSVPCIGTAILMC